MTMTFKKLDKETFYATDGNTAINVYARYSASNRHYEIDAAQFYWECKTIADMKNKVTQYFIDGKFQSFEV